MKLGTRKLRVKEVKLITKKDTGKELYFVTLVDTDLYDNQDFMVNKETYDALVKLEGKDLNFEISVNGKFLNIKLVA